MDRTLSLRINLVDPPDGVAFCLQKGAGEKSECLGALLADGENLTFDLGVIVRKSKKNDLPDFAGPFVQGINGDRFFYICAGTKAGQAESPWERRVKIRLSGITWSMVDAVENRDDMRLEAGYLATAADGGPSCAAVPLLDDAWTVS